MAGAARTTAGRAIAKSNDVGKRNVFVRVRTDDHLRNHGFLLQPDGWKLSPAFDINPDPQGNGLSLNISDDDNSLSLDLAREVAEYFRLSHAQADSIIDEVRQSVSQWRVIANEIGIPRGEQELLRRAFGE